MNFYFEDTKKHIIMTEEDEEDFKENNISQFCEKKIESVKFRDHSHLTGRYRAPAQTTCNIDVTQDHSSFLPFVFHNFSNYDCHTFFKNLNEKKNDKVEYKTIPITDEEYISVKYGCNRFVDGYRFLSSSLYSLVKTLVDNSHKRLKDLEKKLLIMMKYYILLMKQKK